MRVRLAYGTTAWSIEVDPELTTVVEPVHQRAVADPGAALRAALRRPVAGPPLRERVRPGQTVAISACDGTRPQPRHLMIPAILAELDGITRLEDVVILVATGTHRGNDEHELREMFGDEVVASVRIVNHDARASDELAFVGVHGNGVPVWLNRAWLEADVRITTGFVEPHFFAGFSGGPKLVAPAWPGWTPCWCCTTRPASVIRAPPGASFPAIPSTTTSGPSRPRPASRSAWTWC